jgi:hypothetical protein
MILPVRSDTNLRVNHVMLSFKKFHFLEELEIFASMHWMTSKKSLYLSQILSISQIVNLRLHKLRENRNVYDLH